MYKLIFKDKLTKILTYIKTKASIVLRIEFSVELQKEMLRSVERFPRYSISPQPNHTCKIFRLASSDPTSIYGWV